MNNVRSHHTNDVHTVLAALADSILTLFLDANIKCPKPAPIVNGFVKASGKLKSNAKYKCKEGYKIKGVRKRKCLPSGNWSHEEPTCISKFLLSALS